MWMGPLDVRTSCCLIRAMGGHRFLSFGSDPLAVSAGNRPYGVGALRTITNGPPSSRKGVPQRRGAAGSGAG